MLKKLLFSLIAVVGALSALEIGARVWERVGAPEVDASLLPGPGNAEIPGGANLPRNPGAIPMVPGGAGWGFTPNSEVTQGNVVARINSLGVRGPEVPDAREPAELRLLSLGDSSVFGYGVRWGKVFTSVAADQLEDALGRPVRPFSGAIPGHSSDQSLWVLKNIEGPIDPDWVIVANLWSDTFHQETPSGYGEDHPLALYRVTLRWLGPWLKPRQVNWVDVEQGVGTPAPGRAPRTGLTPYMANLKAIHDVATAGGARVLFLILPAPIDLSPGGAPDYIREYREAMRYVAENLGASVADGPAWFEERGATNAMFFDTVHPSVSGHALLGELVAAEIAAAE